MKPKPREGGAPPDPGFRIVVDDKPATPMTKAADEDEKKK